MTTNFHAKYYAHDLTKIGPSTSSDRLSMSLFDACVDLNPHQIEAALFAVRSPISKGVILADEVGLGKTIEAGLVLCQLWAEHKRKLLIICPASLRKQWSFELREKFNLPSVILDAKTYKDATRAGKKHPFEQDSVVIASYNFIANRKEEVKAINWDLVTIDEAHKLRNCYRESNKIGQAVRLATDGIKKILLTATPLQNSLMELYGLCSLIDERIFGDPLSFKSQYTTSKSDLPDLRERLKPFCKRTLRADVLEYVPYTERKLITRPFSPTDEEHKLYEAVSDFLLKENTYAIPHAQKHLTTLVARKLLASSSYAIAKTLETMADRLRGIKEGKLEEQDHLKDIAEAEDLEDYMDEEYAEDMPNVDFQTYQQGGEFTPPPSEAELDLAQLDAEIKELETLERWANSIGIDEKMRTLLAALEVGFKEMTDMGAAQKSLIFTESRRTQDALRDLLEANGYAGKIVLFNGSNNDDDSKKIYADWVEKNQDTGRASGSRPIDIRSAIIEHFRDDAQIMIATEAAAEGVNLQFCSMLVNYDLPWNPQRIEQRIGRVHRYGQKHDVVVINLLNKRNEVDCRVHELLKEKFSLFSGVFGVSDDVLGQLESGVDFEKKITAIWQSCRTPDTINKAFKTLQDSLEEEIQNKMKETQQTLIDHFDDDVHLRLKFHLDGAKKTLDEISRKFWAITKYRLAQNADFNETNYSFKILDAGDAPTAPDYRYHLISKDKENITGDRLYRISHPLGQWVIDQCKTANTPIGGLEFRYTKHPKQITVAKALLGQSGWLTLRLLDIDSFATEQHLLFTAVMDNGKTLPDETCAKLFAIDATTFDLNGQMPPPKLDKEAKQFAEATINQAVEHNNTVFKEEQERMEKWAEDLILSAEKDLHDIKAQLKAAKRTARLATTIEDQHTAQKDIKDLESKQRDKRRKIFDYSDDVEAKRDEIMDDLLQRMRQKTNVQTLFTVRFKVV